MLAGARAESNAQVERMSVKLNDHLQIVKAGFTLDFRRIVQDLTRGSVRERHLAKALRLAVEAKFSRDADRLACYERVFDGKPLSAPLSDQAAVENEIRSKLLKAGGAAFVPEDPTAFLPMETVCRIILAAGGIPTYPFLADDAKGEFTDFEGDLQRAADTLKKRGITSAEFITTRNSTPRWNSTPPICRTKASRYGRYTPAPIRQPRDRAEGLSENSRNHYRGLMQAAHGLFLRRRRRCPIRKSVGEPVC